MSANRTGRNSTRASNRGWPRRPDRRLAATRAALIRAQPETYGARCGQLSAGASLLAANSHAGGRVPLRLTKTARTLLSVTALAWSIPFAQVAGLRDAGLSEVPASSSEYDTRERGRDDRLGAAESLADDQDKDRDSGA
jgi:hypothetical protein